MPETHKAAIIFTLAKRAAWAGDVEYCRERLAELRVATSKRRREGDREPLTLLRDAGRRIEAHLEGKDAPPSELVIKTAHLRGVVWQAGRREFELLAYLIDYSWEEKLCHHAVLAKETRRVTILESEDEEDITDEREVKRQGDWYLQVERAPTVDEGPGLSWEEDIDGLQCVVTVGDLGLIKVKGLWVGREMPQSAEEVERRFRGILDRIESPGGVNINLNSPDEGQQTR